MREKTGGRKLTTPNKNTLQIRNSFQLLIENNLEQLETDLKQLKPLERLKILLEIAKFVIPTLKATELSTSTENGFKPIVIEMTTERAREITEIFNEQY
ncbi:MAG: hypothetical protein GZ087_00380 [Flavobacterium sp.]|nr:hypothetical protein [Flavobacterium sp.]